MRMLVRLAVSRGWRAILVSDCGAEGKGVFEFKGLGGIWLVVFNGRCGVVLDPGMAKCGEGAARNATMPRMAVLWL